ncbi:MAG: hypothetical protein ABR577_04660 [Pyrinomonadaceae bacterium]
MATRKLLSRFNPMRAVAVCLSLIAAALIFTPSTKLMAQSRKATPKLTEAQPATTMPTATPSPQQKTLAQDSGVKQAIDPKAALILQRAVEVLGGSSYTGVRSSIGRGYFTQFKDGVSGNPSAFVDYVVYPDRERTEFGSGRGRTIQTNVGDKGWLYDGATRVLKDITPEQAADFRLAMRTNVDNLLRGVWRKEDGAKLSYVGRREAGIAKRNEAVSLTYADGFVVEFEFGAKDGLPAKVHYTRKDSEGKEAAEEDRLAQFIATGGVLTPFIVDHFRAGLQTSRINYQSIDFNAPIPADLFSKPINLKTLK